MSGYLDKKYVNLLSSSLRNFKRKGGNIFNFSCPLCGDSLSNPRKARGYVYSVGDDYLYTCHNQCGTMPVAKLIKQVNSVLYDEYVKELMLEKYAPKTDIVESFQEQVKHKVEFSPAGLQRVSDLPPMHPCVRYVRERMIGPEWYPRLYYTPKFMEWTNTLIPEKFSEKALHYDRPRLIIPLISKEKIIFGYQGRLIDDLDKSDQKYYSIMLDESYPKIFGLDMVDQSRTFYVLEGPIDSMFVPNSVAAAGSNLMQIAGFINKKNAVLVFDNEPRHKDTCKYMYRAINQDYKLVIWPESWSDKDVNSMIQHGTSPELLIKTMKERTFEGLEAQLEFGMWRKS